MQRKESLGKKTTTSSIVTYYVYRFCLQPRNVCTNPLKLSRALIQNRLQGSCYCVFPFLLSFLHLSLWHVFSHDPLNVPYHESCLHLLPDLLGLGHGTGTLKDLVDGLGLVEVGVPGKTHKRTVLSPVPFLHKLPIVPSQHGSGAPVMDGEAVCYGVENGLKFE